MFRGCRVFFGTLGNLFSYARPTIAARGRLHSAYKGDDALPAPRIVTAP
jgi:hypothetical protein